MLFGWVCVVIFCSFAFCFGCAVTIVIVWIIEHTGVFSKLAEAWVLQKEGITGVGKTFGQIIGKNGEEKNNPRVEPGCGHYVCGAAFPRSGGDCVWCKKIIKPK